jgi:hypothetical protein
MIPNEQTEETPEKATRRSALKRELDAFAELVTILRPLSVEQRNRLTASANMLLGQTE